VTVPRHSLAIALGVFAPVILLRPSWRHALEASMTLHMLAEWPLLAVSGALAWRWVSSTRLGGRSSRSLATIDARGTLGATVLSCVSAFWMIPSAVDASLVDAGMSAFKIASWWVAGLAFAASLPRADVRLLRRLSASMGTMLAVAGVAYMDSNSRLCVDYLVDDQRRTGVGLVTFGGLLAAAALWFFLRPCRRPESRAVAATARSS
jgi:hypothetical protein